MTNRDFVNEVISDKKVKQIIREIDFIHNLTRKFHSSLSHINIYFYLKHRKPIMHTHLFRTKSQNPDFIRNFCNDRNNSFLFPIRKRY